MSGKQQEVEVMNTSTGPRDLSTGRVLAPGERASVTLTDHEQGLIDSGGLTVVQKGGK